tara:strand:+ start:1530 stop:1946 length:417 start_codon:yes stop_codon:yes gene_type:complete
MGIYAKKTQLISIFKRLEFLADQPWVTRRLTTPFNELLTMNSTAENPKTCYFANAWHKVDCLVGVAFIKSEFLVRIKLQSIGSQGAHAGVTLIPMGEDKEEVINLCFINYDRADQTEMIAFDLLDRVTCKLRQYTKKD